MKKISNFEEFVNEEFVGTFKFTKDRAGDKEHDRLAAKDKEGHSWKKAGTKKDGKGTTTKNFSCKCGYKKNVVVDEEKKSTVITYSR